ncbi:hypothetical protein GCM10010182_61400 [Actinomadura cremea]|nr:hypothetical protein GCM10010182_61400 [Actinomadura cremea]
MFSPRRVDVETRRALRDLDRELGRIRELHGGVDARSVTPLEAIDRYTALADGAGGVLFRLTTGLARATGGMVSSGAVNAYRRGGEPASAPGRPSWRSRPCSPSCSRGIPG